MSNETPAEVLAEMNRFPDEFNGDDAKLIRCIEALLSLDAKKALVPHGIGGHARGLLSAAMHRLSRSLAAGKVAPDGYVLRPKTITPEMHAACLSVVDLTEGDPDDHRYDDGYATAQALWSAMCDAAPPADPAKASGSAPDGCYVVRYNDDGEFGQHVGWLYRTGGDPCVISGKPVYVWRPLAELLEKAA